jgi:hypothetical protein
VPSETPPCHPPSTCEQTVPCKPAHSTTQATCHRRPCPATHHHTNKVFLASLITPPSMPNAIEDPAPAVPPYTTVRTKCSSQACRFHHPCQVPSKASPRHPSPPYEQSVSRKPAHSTTHATCHRRPRPATHHHTNKVFLASLIAQPSMPSAIEDPAPVTFYHRTNKVLLASLLIPAFMPSAIEYPTPPPTNVQTKCS